MRKLKKLPTFITFAFLTKLLRACGNEAAAVFSDGGATKIPLDALSIYQLAGGDGNGWRIRWPVSRLRDEGYLTRQQYGRANCVFYGPRHEIKPIDADAARKIAAILTAPQKAPKKAKARPRARR